MKTLTLFVLLFAFPFLTISQEIPSGVFNVSKITLEETNYGSIKNIASGSTRDFSEMNISLVSIDPGKRYSSTLELEKLVIINAGELKLEGKDDMLTKGSVLIIGKNEKIDFFNKKEGYLKFYLFTYRSSDQSISSTTELPFVKDWNTISYKTHDKGGIRNFFDLETPECHKFEMHVTNLNAGIKSHEPHTHRAGEFVLMKNGSTEMEIDGKIYQGNAGDLYFLESEISHAIKNIGDEQCQYFAFQME